MTVSESPAFPRRPKLAIIGIGAMGSLFAGRLSPVAEVTLIGNWPVQLGAVRATGVRLVEPDGQESQHTVAATNDPTAVGPVDFALVLVKSAQTERAARQAAQLLKREGLAVTLQNGLGNLEKLSAVLGRERASQGVTSQGAVLVEPAVVRDAGRGPVHLAETPATVTRLTAFAELLRRADFETTVTPDLNGLVWGKLAVNAGINPLTALLNVPNGYLAEHRWTRIILSVAAEEAAAVAAAQGISLPYPNATEQALAVARATAENRSSMLQDVRRGVTTEIDAICGAIVREGRRLGVPTPVNAQLLALIQNLESGRPLGTWRADLMRLIAERLIDERLTDERLVDEPLVNKK